MDVRLADVIHDHRRAQKPRAHLPVDVVQQRMAHALQAVRIARDQLLRQLARNAHRLLGDQVAVFALALQLDHFVREVVDADAVLLAVAHARDLFLQSVVVDRVEIQRADVILVVLVPVRVELHHRCENAAQNRQLRRRDVILQLVPKGNVADGWHNNSLYGPLADKPRPPAARNTCLMRPVVPTRFPVFPALPAFPPSPALSPFPALPPSLSFPTIRPPRRAFRPNEATSARRSSLYKPGRIRGPSARRIRV